MSLSQRLRWAVSQVPAKRASGAFDRVLGVESMPGTGWRLIDQRAWKTGQSGTNDAWAARAREAGLMTAWRSFEQPTTRSSCWVQVTPLASSADALAALQVVPQRFLGNLRAEVVVTGGHDVDLSAPERCRAVWAHEQTTTGPHGGGISMYVASVVGSTLSVISLSGRVGSWTWVDAGAIAGRQIDLL